MKKLSNIIIGVLVIIVIVLLYINIHIKMKKVFYIDSSEVRKITMINQNAQEAKLLMIKKI